MQSLWYVGQPRGRKRGYNICTSPTVEELPVFRTGPVNFTFRFIFLTLRLGVRFLAPQPLSATNHFYFTFFAF